MFKKIINNQSGISLVEVMVAAGISSVIALSTMKISTNSQKAMRKASRDSDLTSLFNITLRGDLSSNNRCVNIMAPHLNNMNDGDVKTFANGDGIGFSNVVMTVGAALPGFGDEFNIGAMSIERNGDVCELQVRLDRTNAENKLGSRQLTRFLKLGCGFDATGNLDFCSSTESADGGNSPWQREEDGAILKKYVFLDNMFEAATIGDDTGSLPVSKLVISRPDGLFQYGSTSLYNGIGMRNNNVLLWADDPSADAGGVGIAGSQNTQCISLYATNNSDAATLQACASGITLSANVTADGNINITGSNTLTVGGATNLNGGATVQGGLNVASGNLSVATGSLSVAGNADVDGQVFADGLTVDGTSTLNGNTTITGVNTVNGNSVLNGNVSVNGGGTLTVSGASTLGGGLTVNGNSDFNGSADISNGLNVSGGNVTINTSGSLRTDEIRGLGATLAVVRDDGSANFHVSVGGTMQSNYVSSQGINAWNAASSSVFQGNVSMKKNLYVTGTVYHGGLQANSDRRLKYDIETTDLGLEFINSLKPVRYVYKKDKSDNPIYRIGLIAQDIQASIQKHSKDLKDKRSEIVMKNEDTGFFSVSYQSLISPIIQAVKDLFSINEKQDQEIAQLKAENEMLKSALCSKHNNEFKFCDSRGLASEKK